MILMEKKLIKHPSALYDLLDTGDLKLGIMSWMLLPKYSRVRYLDEMTQKCWAGTGGA